MARFLVVTVGGCRDTRRLGDGGMVWFRRLDLPLLGLGSFLDLFLLSKFLALLLLLLLFHGPLKEDQSIVHTLVCELDLVNLLSDSSLLVLLSIPFRDGCGGA